MQQKDLHKLGKTDLLTLIYKQEKQIQKLTKEVEELKQQLENRTIQVKEAGSIAEASLKINKIFEVAQQAADEYLESIKKVNKPSIEYEQIAQNITEDELSNKEKILNQGTYENKIIKQKQTKDRESCKELILVNNKIAVIKPKFLKSVLILFIFIFEKISKFKRKSIENIKFLSKIYLQKLQNIEKVNKINEIITKNKHKFSNVISKIVSNITEKQKVKKVKQQTHEAIMKNMEISMTDIEKELKKRKKIKRKINFIKTLGYSSIVIVAFAIITSTSFFKILQVSGNSMEPNLHEGDLLITSSFFKFGKGDMIAFYYNDSVLIKRVIATEGDIVNIEDDGTVFVNSVKLDESYIKKLSYKNCDITFPYQVPKNSVFILGDNREISIDSRSKAIGSISKDKIIGKIGFKLNPFIIY